jgi:PAS domain S-box-containing protein
MGGVLRTFAERAGRAVLVMRDGGLCVYANPHWTAFTGLDLTHSLEQFWHLAVHPNDLPALLAELEERRREGAPYEIRARVRSAHGEYATYCATCVPMQEDGERRWLVLLDRADLERVADDRFRQLADALPLLVYTTDRDDRITFVNRAWLAYTGLPAGSTIAERNALVHPDDLTRLMHALRNNASEVEFRLRRRSDGAYRWHLLRWSRFTSPTLPFFRIGMLLDVHDQRGEDPR